jgi:hypothetical protein
LGATEVNRDRSRGSPRIFYGLTKAKATLPGENIVTTQK